MRREEANGISDEVGGREDSAGHEADAIDANLGFGQLVVGGDDVRYEIVLRVLSALFDKVIDLRAQRNHRSCHLLIVLTRALRLKHLVERARPCAHLRQVAALGTNERKNDLDRYPRGVVCYGVEGKTLLERIELAAHDALDHPSCSRYAPEEGLREWSSDTRVLSAVEPEHACVVIRPLRRRLERFQQRGGRFGAIGILPQRVVAQDIARILVAEQQE